MIKQIKHWLLSVLDYFRSNKSYSQDGEDVVLAAFFEERKSYKGFFVDVGAHHPVRFSNTWAFYKKGWKGINIDPTPGSMQAFKNWRRRDINLELGIGPNHGVLEFYCFNEPALNTFDPEVARQRNTGKPYKIIKTTQIPISPLKDVLDQHLSPSQEIDFISIDVEGLDLLVLQSNDWEKYRPAYILVEDHKFSFENPQGSEIFVYLKAQGYTIVSILKRTIIYRRS